LMAKTIALLALCKNSSQNSADLDSEGIAPVKTARNVTLTFVVLTLK